MQISLPLIVSSFLIAAVSAAQNANSETQTYAVLGGYFRCISSWSHYALEGQGQAASGNCLGTDCLHVANLVGGLSWNPYSNVWLAYPSWGKYGYNVPEFDVHVRCDGIMVNPWKRANKRFSPTKRTGTCVQVSAWCFTCNK
jgi:hypothetical protein